MVSCEKTGFHAYLDCYDEWLYGDAYKFGDVWVFRICQRSVEPMQGKQHFFITSFGDWFDKDKTSMEQNSTMIVLSVSVKYYGYDGVGIEQEDTNDAP